VGFSVSLLQELLKVVVFSGEGAGIQIIHVFSSRFPLKSDIKSLK
jgi:hypothetical protein